METFSERPKRSKPVEVLRWLGVLPAAVIADFAMQFLGDGLVQFGRYLGTDNLGGSGLAIPLMLCLFYFMPKAAFVMAGAKTAPRYQGAAAIVLTLIGFSFSLLTHVISQHYFAGRRLGFHNYLHLGTESAGLIAGAIYIIISALKSSRRSFGVSDAPGGRA